MKGTNLSKRKNASTIVSEVSLTKHTKGNKEFRFYIVLTKANIELIWCDEYDGQDAFTHPIYDHIINRSKWMVENQFIDYYPWRTSKNINKICYNVMPTKLGQPPFPRRYYLRLVDPGESTRESRFQVLDQCVKVRFFL
jgi:hypothetical protein